MNCEKMIGGFGIYLLSVYVLAFVITLLVGSLLNTGQWFLFQYSRNYDYKLLS